jgi:hypothetical protein
MQVYEQQTIIDKHHPEFAIDVIIQAEEFFKNNFPEQYKQNQNPEKNSTYSTISLASTDTGKSIILSLHNFIEKTNYFLTVVLPIDKLSDPIESIYLHRGIMNAVKGHANEISQNIPNQEYREAFEPEFFYFLINVVDQTLQQQLQDTINNSSSISEYTINKIEDCTMKLEPTLEAIESIKRLEKSAKLINKDFEEIIARPTGKPYNSNTFYLYKYNLQ